MSRFPIVNVKYSKLHLGREIVGAMVGSKVSIVGAMVGLVVGDGVGYDEFDK